MSDTIVYRDVVTGPTRARFGTFLKNELWGSTIDLVEFEEEKGWFRTTTRFAIRGRREEVKRFMDSLVETIEDYNNQ